MAKVASSKKIFLKQTVFDAALERIEWVFNEFEHVVVGFSGGKDSTVTLQLALRVARKLGRTPLDVMFLDQEAEWLATIAAVRQVASIPDVRMHWLQFPFRMFNATSSEHPWLFAWEPGVDWVRPKEPDSIQENRIGTDRFHEVFPAWIATEYPKTEAVYLAGVRCEESPNRARGLVAGNVHKGVTWGKVLSPYHKTFYPLYDWSYIDIWKAIHDNFWPYCSLYDSFYQYGVPHRDMRVSNLHHETAVRSLFMLQELEPTNYAKIVRRIPGVDMAGKLSDNYFCPKELPGAFGTWKEYRDYLTMVLLPEPWQEKFYREYERQDLLYLKYFGDGLYRRQIASVMTNDHEFVKMRAISLPKEQWNDFKRHRVEVRRANPDVWPQRNRNDLEEIAEEP